MQISITTGINKQGAPAGTPRLFLP